MKTENLDQKELQSLTDEQLHKLFQETNSAFAKNLINGAGLNEEQNNIDMLNKISRLLNLRRPQHDNS